MDLRAVPDLNAKDQEDAIRQLCTLLFKEGYVTEDYVNAVLQREKTYPTGLDLTSPIKVAIPHGDIRQVKKPAFAIGILRQPVSFKRMDDPEQELQVKIVFLLALSKAETVAHYLRRLALIFQHEEVIEKLAKADNASQIISLFNQELGGDSV